MFLFFTELHKWDVIDRHGRWIGWPEDLCLDLQGAYPPVTGLVVRSGRVQKRYAVVPWEKVCTAQYEGHTALQIRVSLETLIFAKGRPAISEPTVRRNVLDQQVVDIYNRKVVRVNDVHLLQVDSHFRIAHVDVGLRGMMRRLGWERLVDRVMRWVHPHAHYLTREGFIGWKYVQPLTINPAKGTIPIAVSHKDIAAIPPADLSEILEALDPYQRVALFRSLDAPTKAEILGELDERFVKELIAELDTKTAVAVLDVMPADEATDLLQYVSRRDVRRLLEAMGSRRAQKLSELLAHEEDAAGGLMTTEVIRLPIEATVRDAIEQIKTMSGVAETIYYAYVVDTEQRLQGVVDFRTLLVESMEKPLKEIMNPRPIAVQLDDSAKEVAFVLEKYNFVAVPVVDEDNGLRGIITVDDVLSIVIEKAYGDKSGLM